jgi:DNA-binding SARP family transcriptional activator
VTLAELGEAVWPDAAPGAWEAALHALISKLRNVLRALGDPGPMSLTSAFGTYLLHVDTDVWIDREAAAEAIDQAEAFLRADDVRQAWAPCNIAAIISRRAFLAGEDSDWIAREREALESILVRSLACMTDIWVANGESALALKTARESVKLEPFRETGYVRLMGLHRALGDRAEALRVYESCRALLASELGVDPSPETQAIYLDLLGAP